MNAETRAVPTAAQGGPALASGLWRAVAGRSRRALHDGALQPIETDRLEVVEGGIRFAVHVARSLVRKDAERARDRRPADPFSPPEPALLVGALSHTHLAVLNKFSVLPRHLLLVTREFERQTDLLTAADFAAYEAVLVQAPALCFYNGGEAAGASQAHKHLQVLPLPLTDDTAGLPLGALLSRRAVPDRVTRLPVFAFEHALIGLPDADPGRSVEALHAAYRTLVERTEVGPGNGRCAGRQRRPYNLLFTRDWMLLVPRSREHWNGVSVNALGFVGSLFVRRRGEALALRRHGVIRALGAVGVPIGPGAG